EVDLLLHVVDASHEGYVEQEETVHSILTELDAHTIPMLTVYNKKDLLERDFVGGTSPNTIISVYNKQDLSELLQKMEQLVKEEWYYYFISPQTDNDTVMKHTNINSIIIKKENTHETNQYDIEGYIASTQPLHWKIKEK